MHTTLLRSLQNTQRRARISSTAGSSDGSTDVFSRTDPPMFPFTATQSSRTWKKPSSIVTRRELAGSNPSVL